jgi:O-antigen ligase/tetratricopeptide (TPR) repeat protein
MTSLERALRWIVIVGVFALPFIPLYIANSLFFPYITGKNFAFRIIVEIIMGAWLALVLVSDQYRPRRNWILGALALFVLVIAIADAQGVNPFKSFWSNYERMDGWITIAHLLLYTTVASSVLATETLWRRLFHTSLGISVLLSMLGFLQIAGIFDIGSGGTGLSARIDVSFGNPIYFAVYMLFHVFLAALLWAQMHTRRGSNEYLWPSIAYGTIIVLDTIALFLTGTRGTMIGIIGGGLLSLLLYALSSQASRSFKRATVAVFIGIIILGGVLVGARDTAFVQRVGFLQRLATISTTDNTTKARFLNWGMAWEGIKERPILGWGQENYAIVFDKYYDPRMYAQEQWFDRVHNIVFDWLVAGGFVGFFSYLAIFAITVRALWWRTRTHDHIFTIAERSLLTGLLVAYFIHNFFVFDNVTSYILFGTVLAYIIWRINEARGAISLYKEQLLPREALPAVAVVMIAIVCGAVYIINGKALAANLEIIAALQQPHTEADVAEHLSRFKKAIAYGTFGSQEAREQLAQMATQLAGSNISNDLKMQFLKTSVRELSLQANVSPLDARFPLFAGVTQNAYGDYSNALVSLQRAHELSPRKQTILFEIGANAMERKDAPAALAAFKSAYELAPDFLDARIYYAAVLIRMGNDAAADQILAPITTTGEAADARIASAYADRHEYGKIVSIWTAHVKAQPTDAQGYFTLAAALYAMGNANGAVATLEHVKSIIPITADQANAFIQQIKDGTAKVQ